MTVDIKYFRVYSDLHLEFGAFKIPELPTDKQTLLILAGDITIYPFSVFWFANLARRFAHIIYVLGNHEHYHGNIKTTKTVIEQSFEDEFFTNNYSVVDDPAQLKFDGFRILAGTLWTNMDGDNPVTKSIVGRGLNDYRLITNLEGTTLRPDDTIAKFKYTIEKFEEFFAEPYDGKTYVVTHHLPSYSAISKLYRSNADKINGGYASNLDEFILTHQPEYWFFGHSHTTNNFKIGNTTLFSNPRGYADKFGGPQNKNFNEIGLIELK